MWIFCCFPLIERMDLQDHMTTVKGSELMHLYEMTDWESLCIPYKKKRTI